MGLFKETNGNAKVVRIGVVIFVGVILITILFPVIMSKFPCVWNEQFGVMFGVLSALFTGLAFAATFVTLLFHQQEIKKQNEMSNMGFFEGHYIRMQQELKDFVSTIRINDVSNLSQPINYFGKEALRVLSERPSISNSDQIVLEQYVNRILSIMEYVDDSQLIEDRIKSEYICEIIKRLDKYELKILSKYCKLQQLIKFAKYDVVQQIIGQ